LAVGGRQTRGGADGTIDVNQAAADPTNQVVMIIADAIFKSGRQPRGLNAADEALGHQHAERIIDRLQRDSADFGPDELGNAVGSDMWLACHHAHDRQSLSRHLDAVFAKQGSGITDHVSRLLNSLNDSKIASERRRNQSCRALLATGVSGAFTVDCLFPHNPLDR
jgi:hypothetical protein